MSAVLEQIDHMSVSDKMRIMEYLVKSIEQTVVRLERTNAPRRVMSPDPALHCEIKCDLFEDDSSLWKSA